MLKLAKNIVRDGTEEALEDVPIAKFGSLVTVDREEMENFRRISNLVQKYKREESTKPLSIGVFGQPGSGKSFGVKEVIKAMEDAKTEILEFNLSQFLEYSDLITAFHTIRDQTLSNKVPVAIFDEFDCSLGGKALGWLQYFLAPMQDSKFLEGGHRRPLGKAIFFFVGGTSPTFERFQATMGGQEAIAAKKPDFVSRLDDSVDICGPDKLSSRGDDDQTYTVRRAIILRSLVEKNKLVHMKGVKGAEKAEFKVKENALNALLCITKFHHGSRSLEAIIKASQIESGEELTPARLLSNDRLALYVDPIELREWLNGWWEKNEEIKKKIAKDIREKLVLKVDSSESSPPIEFEYLGLNQVEKVLLSEEVARNISVFLGKPSNLIEKREKTEGDEAAIARGVYDTLEAIRRENDALVVHQGKSGKEKSGKGGKGGKEHLLQDSQCCLRNYQMDNSEEIHSSR